MGILLGFTPFILFSLLTGLSVSLALWVAFAAAFAIGIRDFLRAKTVRLLDAVCLALFALLAIYSGFIQPSLTVQAVRMIADAGLLLLAVISLAMRSPFTLQYSRDEAPEELWETPAFVRANYILAAVWSVAFAVMTTADAYATFNKRFPLSLDVAVGLAALALAIVFTVRYPAGSRHFAGSKR
ncbi:MAG TPA: hypothetical protein VL971_03395 [Rhizomicrobium sp.]|jgi:hypothetical protein|nr:hypothetical protein [Rhizomicrobium sp.]